MLRRLLLAFAALAVLCGPPAAAQARRIAITFDDAPRDRGAFFTPEERTRRLIEGLRRAKVKQAAFFLNPGYLARPDGRGGEARISAYVEAGHVIANHTWNHVPLSAIGAEQFLGEVDLAQAWLANRKGYRPWFRFPQLDEGRADSNKRDLVRAGLAARGLLNAQVTADGSDWFLESLTVDAARAGKTMDRKALGRLYVTVHMSGIETADAFARKLLGRSPAHVLLLHETDLAALYLPDLIAELERHGWTIIAADRAFADPLYRTVPRPAEARGNLLSAIAQERGIAAPLWPVAIDPFAAKLLFDRQVLGQQTPLPL